MKGQALIIGLNGVDPKKYEDWDGKLKVCENDANNIEKKLKGLKYKTTVLLTAAATRQAVLDGIDAAAKSLKSGDQFVLYYSGHGGQMPDVNNKKIVDGGDEADGLDETWCLYDGELIDDILYQRWFKFKAGVNIIVLSDSCHSGSVIKNTARGLTRGADPELVYKVMPTDVAIKVFANNEKEYRAFNKKECPMRISKTKPLPAEDIKASVVLIGACQDNQLSQAQTFSYPDNSLFTAELLKLMNKKPAPNNYTSLAKTIRLKLPSDQQPELMTLGKKAAQLLLLKPFKL